MGVVLGECKKDPNIILMLWDRHKGRVNWKGGRKVNYEIGK